MQKAENYLVYFFKILINSLFLFFHKSLYFNVLAKRFLHKKCV